MLIIQRCLSDGNTHPTLHTLKMLDNKVSGQIYQTVPAEVDMRMNCFFTTASAKTIYFIRKITELDLLFDDD